MRRELVAFGQAMLMVAVAATLLMMVIIGHGKNNVDRAWTLDGVVTSVVTR